MTDNAHNIQVIRNVLDSYRTIMESAVLSGGNYTLYTEGSMSDIEDRFDDINCCMAQICEALDEDIE